ncbi:MAG: hypothetical protein RJA69_2011 [Pseudomonadota bacterium]|jgi:hypothetical protein
MDTGSGMRIDSLSGQGRGYAMGTPDQRRRRAQGLIQLVHALEEGDLDAARVQFAGLVQVDPGLSQQPLLHRIGNALQSSNLKAAQQLAQDLRDEGLAVWNDLAHAHRHPGERSSRPAAPTPPVASLPMPVRVHRASNGQHIIDFRA